MIFRSERPGASKPASSRLPDIGVNDLCRARPHAIAATKTKAGENGFRDLRPADAAVRFSRRAAPSLLASNPMRDAGNRDNKRSAPLNAVRPSCDAVRPALNNVFIDASKSKVPPRGHSRVHQTGPEVMLNISGERQIRARQDRGKHAACGADGKGTAENCQRDPSTIATGIRQRTRPQSESQNICRGTGIASTTRIFFRPIFDSAVQQKPHRTGIFAEPPPVENRDARRKPNRPLIRSL